MSLDALLGEIEREGREEAGRLVREAREEAERIARETDERLARHREASLAAHEAELRASAESEVAAARREARGRVLEVRQALLERAFAAAEAPGLRERALEALRASLRRRLGRAIACVDTAGAEVACSPALAEDVKRALADLAGGSGREDLRVRPDPGLGAGIRIASHDGRTELDITLSGRLERARGPLSIAALEAFAETGEEAP